MKLFLIDYFEESTLLLYFLDDLSFDICFVLSLVKVIGDFMQRNDLQIEFFFPTRLLTATKTRRRFDIAKYPYNIGIAFVDQEKAELFRLKSRDGKSTHCLELASLEI